MHAMYTILFSNLHCCQCTCFSRYELCSFFCNLCLLLERVRHIQNLQHRISAGYHCMSQLPVCCHLYSRQSMIKYIMKKQTSGIWEQNKNDKAKVLTVMANNLTNINNMDSLLTANYLSMLQDKCIPLIKYWWLLRQ